jgi:hypothetical protein
VSTVFTNVAGHPIDLDTGRSLAPGEEAEDVNAAHPHNQALIARGQAVASTTRKNSTSRPAKPAADHDGEDK